MTTDRNKEFSYEIIEETAILSVNPTSNWQRRLQRVSWCNGPAKWDIRDWSPEIESGIGQIKMSRGITLTDSEMDVIRDLVLQGRI